VVGSFECGIETLGSIKVENFLTSCETVRFSRSALPMSKFVSVTVNPLTPDDPYRGRTAPLISEVAFYIFIQQI